jgi:hypothetical protein
LFASSFLLFFFVFVFWSLYYNVLILFSLIGSFHVLTAKLTDVSSSVGNKNGAEAACGWAALRLETLSGSKYVDRKHLTKDNRSVIDAMSYWQEALEVVNNVSKTTSGVAAASAVSTSHCENPCFYVVKL